jgi:hypothetical protein
MSRHIGYYGSRRDWRFMMVFGSLWLAMLSAFRFPRD